MLIPLKGKKAAAKGEITTVKTQLKHSHSPVCPNVI